MACVEEPPEKHCWVCFASEREDRVAEWVSPCRCKGCTKWIHQSCLQRWLDEKQKGNSAGRSAAPSAGQSTESSFPKWGPWCTFSSR
uniref:E3 ubiquitin-protein ligase MARCHF5 n=1 Tax=Anguilla anguilla TaxID=7936 RepID=A0A0E9SWW8_ANGAN